ncbi:MAG TPA: hypothetical protein VFK02_11560 [Kofleriaceae bacterium]|nr:hypothetical protein [Kofleriaceae bacterium]
MASRPDDSTFRDAIVEMLETSLSHLRKKREIYEEIGDERLEATRARESELARHIANVRTEIVAARFRPEEVAAASALEEHPAVYAQVVEPAARIVAQFEARAIARS